MINDANRNKAAAISYAPVFGGATSLMLGRDIPHEPEPADQLLTVI